MQSSKSLKFKDIVFIFLPLLVMILIQYGVVIADIIIIFIKNLISDEKSANAFSVNLIMTRDYNQPMNIAYVTLARYIVFIVVFGIWLRKISSVNERKQLVNRPVIPAIFFIILAGIVGQFFVDSALMLARPFFPTAFAEYDKQVTSQVFGASASYVLYFTIFFIAPIAEEILFRGLLQKYIGSFFHKIMDKGAVLCTILFQALLFGIYHGNMIQGIYAFVLGTLLGVLAVSFNSLIPGILFHMTINTSILLAPVTPFLFKTTATTIITGVVCLIILVGCTWLSVKLQKQRSSDK
ncbi:MAG: CPBP family intramembrane metalloprotease [Clostridium sp.]|nr:CPBP family intramembrane metalloprotease [Clostridium sp.]